MRHPVSKCHCPHPSDRRQLKLVNCDHLPSHRLPVGSKHLWEACPLGPTPSVTWAHQICPAEEYVPERNERWKWWLTKVPLYGKSQRNGLRIMHLGLIKADQEGMQRQESQVGTWKTPKASSWNVLLLLCFSVPWGWAGASANTIIGLKSPVYKG